MSISRRHLLKWIVSAPVISRYLLDTAYAAGVAGNDDKPILLLIRMLGGNDGLNTVVPVDDDRYYRLRPTIALRKDVTLPVTGSELRLNPFLGDVRRLIDDGHMTIVQGVGYPRPSRSHLRSTEIWETASVAVTAPTDGWMGRYVDVVSTAAEGRFAAVQFGTELGRSLTSRKSRSVALAHPNLLLETFADIRMRRDASPSASLLAFVNDIHGALDDTARRLRPSLTGTGSRFGYPDTQFGHAMRWVGNMIERNAPTRVYQVTLGSFDTPDSASFDTHIDQRTKHQVLFTDFGRGLRAFRDHLRATGQLNRVVALTFSDFGRQVGENKTGGTDHGDAGVMFVMGERVRPGLAGAAADLGAVTDGGLNATVDFRQVYADVLRTFLLLDPSVILDEPLSPFPVIA